MNIRKITSLTALLAFLFLMLTSVILYIVPAGRIAYWSDWRLWGLSKTQWSEMHLNLGVLLLLTICLHIYYNWKPIIQYLKNKAKKLTVFTRDFNAALLIILVFLLGTYFTMPPFSTIINISEGIKDKAAIKYGEPPFGHAELARLKSFVKKTGLDLETSLKLMEQKGIKFEGPDQIFLDIAKKNRMTPKQVFEAITPQEKEGGIKGLPEVPAPGLGKLTLSQICEKAELNHLQIIKELEADGLAISADKKMKDLARQNNLTPIELYDAIRDASLR